MNKSVLRTAIVVIICMLAFEYILKFFFPEEFVLVVSSPNIIKFGQYVDTHKFAYFLFYCVTAFITYFLYTCACCRKKILNWRYYILFLIIYTISHFLTFYAYNLLTPFLVCSMIALACISNSDIRNFSIIFITHTVAQVLSLEIRGLTQYISTPNTATMFILGMESYLWLLLFYFLNCFNIKEREVK